MISLIIFILIVATFGLWPFYAVAAISIIYWEYTIIGIGILVILKIFVKLVRKRS